MIINRVIIVSFHCINAKQSLKVFMMGQSYLLSSFEVESLRSELSSGSVITVLDAYQLLIDQVISLSIKSCDARYDILVTTRLMIVLYSMFGILQAETTSSYMGSVLDW